MQIWEMNFLGKGAANVNFGASLKGGVTANGLGQGGGWKLGLTSDVFGEFGLRHQESPFGGG